MPKIGIQKKCALRLLKDDTKHIKRRSKVKLSTEFIEFRDLEFFFFFSRQLFGDRFLKAEDTNK